MDKVVSSPRGGAPLKVNKQIYVYRLGAGAYRVEKITARQSVSVAIKTGE